MDIEVLVNDRYQCGEGPHWDHANNRLIFNDIFGRNVTVVDLETKEAKKHGGMEETVSSVIPRASNKNEVVICHGLNLEFLDLVTGKRAVLGSADQGTQNRFNDAKCDPEISFSFSSCLPDPTIKVHHFDWHKLTAGRIWAGTMGPEASPGNVDKEKGSVFCVEKDGSMSKKFDKVNIANGLAWSRDHKVFYYIDSLLRTVDAFDYDVETGEIKNRRTAIDVQSFEPFEHIPDGMCIDAEGMLWVALFNGGKVIRCDPNTGKKLSEVIMPVKQTTSCCFAGPNLDQLIVTSASLLSDEEFKQQPQAGCVFRVRNLGVCGLQAVSYAG